MATTAVTVVIIGCAVIVPINKSFADLPAPTKALPRFFTFEVDDAASSPILVIPSAALIASSVTSGKIPFKVANLSTSAFIVLNNLAADSKLPEPFNIDVILVPSKVLKAFVNSPIDLNCFI